MENAKTSDQAALPGGRMRVRHVQRRPDIEAVRSELPISGMEQEVMECILENDVVVLCGETGCGKTTQVSFSGVFWMSYPSSSCLSSQSCHQTTAADCQNYLCSTSIARHP